MAIVDTTGGGGGGSEAPAGNYQCTARQNRIMFEDAARSGKFQQAGGGEGDASAYNSMYAQLYEAEAEEARQGTCDPTSTTPNPEYSDMGAKIDGLAAAAASGKTIKVKPDGSWDLSDPDTAAIAAKVGLEEKKAGEEPGKPSESGSGQSGGGGGGSGSGSGGSAMEGMSGGGGGSSGGGGGGGTPTPEQPRPPATDREAAAQECRAKLGELKGATQAAYNNLTAQDKAKAAAVMAGVGTISESDPCAAVNQWQSALNKVVAANSDMGNAAVETKTINPITGELVTQTAWYDPQTNDCYSAETYQAQGGAPAQVVTKTTPTGVTTGVTAAAGGVEEAVKNMQTAAAGVAAECERTLASLRAAGSIAYDRLTPAQRQRAQTQYDAMMSYAGEACYGVTVVQGYLNYIAAQSADIGEAIETTTRNPATGVDTTVKTWTDPDGNTYAVTDTVNTKTGATTKVLTKTDAQGSTTGANLPAGGNPNTPAAAQGGKDDDLMLWGLGAIALVALSGDGGKKK